MYMVELRGNPLLWVSSGEWSDLFKLLLFILPIKGKESTNKKKKKKTHPNCIAHLNYHLFWFLWNSFKKNFLIHLKTAKDI